MRISAFIARAAVVAALVLGAAAAAAQTPPIYRYQSPGIAPGAAGDWSGSAVSHDGGWMAVGAPGYDDGDMIDSGRVGIFRWLAGKWRLIRWLQLSSLTGESALVSARFGAAVSVSGDRVLIGCPNCRDGRAKAYLVELDESTEPATFYKLYPAIISEPDFAFGIGSAVALNGSIVAIGAPRGRSSSGGVERGSVATGRFDGTTVVWEDVLFGPESPDGSRFGRSLALASTSSGTPLGGHYSLLVGAPAYNTGSGVAGSAYLYQRSYFASGWDFRQPFENAAPGATDAMGTSVAIDRASTDVDGYVVLGAPGRSVDGTPGGGVFVYRRAVGESTYTFEKLVQHPDAESGDRFGIAVGIDGTRLVVGADGRAQNAATDEGRGYVFERFVLLGNVGWPWRQDLNFPGAGNVGIGRALTMSRKMVALGAPYLALDGSGVVTVYTCDSIFVHGFDSAAATRSCALP